MPVQWQCEEMEVPLPIATAVGGEDVFDHVMALRGDVFRDVPGRKTMRVSLAGRSYFVKLHFGVGWREIFKNLLSLRLPIVSARTEWLAIHKFNELGIPTTPAVAYGCRGTSPASLLSFVITEDLGDIISLEDFSREWSNLPPALPLKRRLLGEVARIARTLHDNGLNHRDFYICHFCLDASQLAKDEIKLYLIDLHRVGIHRHISVKARMKDMAALYFSALDIGLSERDCLRFLRLYRGKGLSQIYSREKTFWHGVCDRAEKLYVKFHGRPPAKIHRP
jgi:heptose I phosphotransferase